jgi:hypothetical protein
MWREIQLWMVDPHSEISLEISSMGTNNMTSTFGIRKLGDGNKTNE